MASSRDPRSKRDSRQYSGSSGPRWGRIALVAVAGLVALVAIGWAAVGVASSIGGLLAPDKPVAKAKPQVKAPALAATATPDATASASAEASGSSSASSSADATNAIAAAAVPFPDAPAVESQTISRLHPADKMVAITLDDGAGYDIRLLELFEANDLHLTTFLLGQFVKNNPKFTERLVKDGFEIANHTWDHSDLAKMSSSEIKAELTKTQKVISGYTGNQAPYMRPPGGATNTQVRQTSAKLGYTVVLWNKSFADTSQAATPDRLYHNVIDGVKPGDIILCHWGGKSTYGAMKLIVPELQRQGYKIVSLSEMVAASKTSTGN